MTKSRGPQAAIASAPSPRSQPSPRARRPAGRASCAKPRWRSQKMNVSSSCIGCIKSNYYRYYSMLHEYIIKDIRSKQMKFKTLMLIVYDTAACLGDTGGTLTLRARSGGGAASLESRAMRRAPLAGKMGSDRRPAAAHSRSVGVKGRPKEQQGRDQGRRGLQSCTTGTEAGDAAQEQAGLSAVATRRSARLRAKCHSGLAVNGQRRSMDKFGESSATSPQSLVADPEGTNQRIALLLSLFLSTLSGRLVARSDIHPFKCRCAFEKVEWPHGNLFLTEPALNRFRESTNKSSYSKCSADKRRQISDALTDTCCVVWSRQMVLVVTSNSPFEKYHLKGYSWNAKTGRHNAEVCLEEKRSLAAPSGLGSYSAWILEKYVEDESRSSAGDGGVELLLRGAPGPSGEVLLRGDQLP
eukprot:6173561-Pleurochrysis_carterae.AAC.2